MLYCTYFYSWGNWGMERLNSLWKGFLLVREGGSLAAGAMTVTHTLCSLLLRLFKVVIIRWDWVASKIIRDIKVFSQFTWSQSTRNSLKLYYIIFCNIYAYLFSPLQIVSITHNTEMKELVLPLNFETVFWVSLNSINTLHSISTERFAHSQHCWNETRRERWALPMRNSWSKKGKECYIVNYNNSVKNYCGHTRVK